MTKKQLLEKLIKDLELRPITFTSGMTIEQAIDNTKWEILEWLRDEAGKL